MTDLDLDRLATDRRYWDQHAPEGATHFYVDDDFSAFEKHTDDAIFRPHNGDWYIEDRFYTEDDRWAMQENCIARPEGSVWTPTSERWPTREDADYFHRVIAWDSEHEQMVLLLWFEVEYRKGYSHFTSTGVKVPEPPGGS